MNPELSTTTPPNPPVTPFDRKYYWTLAGWVIFTLAIIIAVACVRAHYAPHQDWVDKFPWQAAGGLLVGEFTLITFLFNREQQQRHFDAKQTADRDFYGRKEAQERTNYDRKALADEFSDILNRFSSDKSAIKANAAIRLAEMAETQRPDAARDFTPANYPYFPRATSQLTAALHMETEDSVRAEIVKALNRMTEFAKNNESESFQHLLVNELADANRTAKKAFIKAVAEYMAHFSEIDEETEMRFEDIITDEKSQMLNQLSIVAPFCVGKNAKYATRAWQAALMSTEEYKAATTLCVAVRRASSPEERQKQDHLSIEPVRLYAARLMDTRNVLAVALRVLHPPKDAPTTLEEWEKWKRPNQLLLAECFLAGASFGAAQLQGVSLARAQLQGASLFGAQLQGASLFKAQLQGASLAWAHLQGALLNSAQLQGASLRNAHLQEAKLINIRYEEGEGEAYCHADFTEANWWEAKLTMFGLKGTPFKEWLQKNFPQRKNLTADGNEAVVKAYQTTEETTQQAQNIV